MSENESTVKVTTIEEHAEENPQVNSLKNAFESISKTLSTALENRANVVMVRVNDKALQKLDMLIEAEITKSRSESAAFLITEGIKANQELFAEIGKITEQIAALRAQLRQTVQSNVAEEKAPNPGAER
ncbi:MAG TPA: hypothetical protein G4N98_08450 [Thermoflexia bacterium]|nr:hypothetical protein [Thermoflexia bacterium]